MSDTLWTKAAPHAAAISEEATDLMAIMVLLVKVARRPALPRHEITSPADRLNTRVRRQSQIHLVVRSAVDEIVMIVVLER